METALRPPTDFTINRYHVDLSNLTVRHEAVACEDFEDMLGGIARATKLFTDLQFDDPYDPAAPLVMNLGALSGTHVMTGLRTFFHGFSPLKESLSGKPGVMWSAGSGHFGTKLRGLGIDEVVFTGRAARPTLLYLSAGGEGEPAKFEFLDASDLQGRLINDRIQDLHGRWPEAHFAVIGNAGENYAGVRYAAIALSTDNQLASGDAKMRFCGRGGYGGVMGSKNLYAIAADGPNPGRVRGLRDINKEINTGAPSARYRDLEHDRGGTWRNVKMLSEEEALPEYNFAPTGTDVSKPLWRPSVEEGPYEVFAESCYLCGIKCHKNVYLQDEDGERGRFVAKVDYEPITLLTSNLGIFDPQAAIELIELGDELGLDSISLGTTLGYAMDCNRRNGSQIAGGLQFGDVAATMAAMRAIAAGKLEELGQGVKRLSEQIGELGNAMQNKGVEYPAYQPQTNPGYPWALAGGHMTMRTFLLYVIERETGIDYWVDAITNRGPLYLMDDITGLCKFGGATAAMEAEGLGITNGLAITASELEEVTMRTFLRGYANERRHGFVATDYLMPAEAHEPMGDSNMEHFNTVEFFEEVHSRVMDTFDERAVAAGFM